MEELIGGQWFVCVGGLLALPVGAVLLICFSIEAGFFGPAARIGMAVVLGVVLLLAGEWLRRSDDKVLEGRLGEAAKALQRIASVPGLLSAARRWLYPAVQDGDDLRRELFSAGWVVPDADRGREQ